MFNLIPVSLLISAIGGIIYIVSNHLSEFSGDDSENDDFSLNLKAHFIGWINQLPLDSVKNQSLSLAQRTLHRLRLFLLKSDNHLSKLIGKISQRDKSVNGNGAANGKDDNFWEDLAGKKQQQEKIVSPSAESEVKIDFAIKNEKAKNFFDSVVNRPVKEMDIKKPIKTSEKFSIEPAAVSNIKVNAKPVKKTLKTKKVKK